MYHITKLLKSCSHCLLYKNNVNPFCDPIFEILFTLVECLTTKQVPFKPDSVKRQYITLKIN